MCIRMQESEVNYGIRGIFFKWSTTTLSKTKCCASMRMNKEDELLLNYLPVRSVRALRHYIQYYSG